MTTQFSSSSMPSPRLGTSRSQRDLWVHRCPPWCDSTQCHQSLDLDGHLWHQGVLETVHSTSDGKTYVITADHLDQPVPGPFPDLGPILSIRDSRLGGDDLGDLTPLGALALAEALQRVARRLLAS